MNEEGEGGSGEGFEMMLSRLFEEEIPQETLLGQLILPIPSSVDEQLQKRYEDILQRNEALNHRVVFLERENNQLQERNSILRNNLTAVYRTSLTEIRFRDLQIVALRKQLQSVLSCENKRDTSTAVLCEQRTPEFASSTRQGDAFPLNESDISSFRHQAVSNAGEGAVRLSRSCSSEENMILSDVCSVDLCPRDNTNEASSKLENVSVPTSITEAIPVNAEKFGLLLMSQAAESTPSNNLGSEIDGCPSGILPLNLPDSEPDIATVDTQSEARLVPENFKEIHNGSEAEIDHGISSEALHLRQSVPSADDNLAVNCVEQAVSLSNRQNTTDTLITSMSISIEDSRSRILAVGGSEVTGALQSNDDMHTETTASSNDDVFKETTASQLLSDNCTKHQIGKSISPATSSDKLRKTEKSRKTSADTRTDGETNELDPALDFKQKISVEIVHDAGNQEPVFDAKDLKVGCHEKAASSRSSSRSKNNLFVDCTSRLKENLAVLESKQPERNPVRISVDCRERSLKRDSKCSEKQRLLEASTPAVIDLVDQSSETETNSVIDLTLKLKSKDCRRSVDVSRSRKSDVCGSRKSHKSVQEKESGGIFDVEKSDVSNTAVTSKAIDELKDREAKKDKNVEGHTRKRKASDNENEPPAKKDGYHKLAPERPADRGLYVPDRQRRPSKDHTVSDHRGDASRHHHISDHRGDSLLDHHGASSRGHHVSDRHGDSSGRKHRKRSRKKRRNHSEDVSATMTTPGNDGRRNADVLEMTAEVQQMKRYITLADRNDVAQKIAQKEAKRVMDSFIEQKKSMVVDKPEEGAAGDFERAPAQSDRSNRKKMNQSVDSMMPSQPSVFTQRALAKLKQVCSPLTVPVNSSDGSKKAEALTLNVTSSSNPQKPLEVSDLSNQPRSSVASTAGHRENRIDRNRKTDSQERNLDAQHGCLKSISTELSNILDLGENTGGGSSDAQLHAISFEIDKQNASDHHARETGNRIGRCVTPTESQLRTGMTSDLRSRPTSEDVEALSVHRKTSTPSGKSFRNSSVVRDPPDICVDSCADMPPSCGEESDAGGTSPCQSDCLYDVAIAGNTPSQLCFNYADQADDEANTSFEHDFYDFVPAQAVESPMVIDDDVSDDAYPVSPATYDAALHLVKKAAKYDDLEQSGDVPPRTVEGSKIGCEDEFKIDDACEDFESGEMSPQQESSEAEEEHIENGGDEAVSGEISQIVSKAENSMNAQCHYSENPEVLSEGIDMEYSDGEEEECTEDVSTLTVANEPQNDLLTTSTDDVVFNDADLLQVCAPQENFDVSSDVEYQLFGSVSSSPSTCGSAIAADSSELRNKTGGNNVVGLTRSGAAAAADDNDLEDGEVSDSTQGSCDADGRLRPEQRRSCNANRNRSQHWRRNRERNLNRSHEFEQNQFRAHRLPDGVKDPAGRGTDFSKRHRSRDQTGRHANEKLLPETNRASFADARGGRTSHYNTSRRSHDYSENRRRSSNNHNKLIP